MTVLINPPHVAREPLSHSERWSADANLLLATLVNIEGSAPYPVGTQMLVDGNAVYQGYITGGCAEQAIADYAVGVMAERTQAMQRFGLNSPFFDIRLPCGSGIDVLFDATLERARLNRWAAHLRLERTPVTYKCSTSWGDLIRPILPAPRLILVGQGPILVALGQMAQQSGFEAVIGAFDAPTHAQCKAVGLAVNNRQELELASLVKDQFTGFISVFHEHEFEIELFQTLSGSRFFYQGALGSRQTHARRCAELTASGMHLTDIAKIKGPVGLDLHAHSPQDIALSIISEAVSIWNQRVRDTYLSTWFAKTHAQIVD